MTNRFHCSPLLDAAEMPTDPRDPRAALILALVKLPRRRDFTPQETARVAQCKAFVAAGGQCRTTDEVLTAARAPTYVIRGPLGYYCGPTELHRPGFVAPPKWADKPSPFWQFGSQWAAEERIKDRGWVVGVEAWVEEVTITPR